MRSHQVGKRLITPRFHSRRTPGFVIGCQFESATCPTAAREKTRNSDSKTRLQSRSPRWQLMASGVLFFHDYT